MDEEAGNLGLPFTEPEDEESRVGWVDWWRRRVRVAHGRVTALVGDPGPGSRHFAVVVGLQGDIVGGWGTAEWSPGTH